MRNICFIFIFILSFSGLYGQVECKKELQCRVIARSGLLMRAKPTTSAPVVKSIPYDSTLIACNYTYGTFSYEGIHGHWRKVFHQGAEGYMFDGFLEIMAIKEDTTSLMVKSENDTNRLRNQPVETTADSIKVKPAPSKMFYNILLETYNYCGDVRSIDPGLRWFGVYLPTEENPYSRIEEVELEVKLSKSKLGEGLEFDVETERTEKSLFLFGINRPLPLETNLVVDHSEELRIINHKLFPGQRIRLGESKKSPQLYATGNVTGTGECPENYKLILEADKFSLPQTQELNTLISDPGKCGMPEIYWYGDLNGDDFPEIILVSVKEDRNIFTLLMSDTTMKVGLLKKEAEWTIQNCY